MNKEILQKPDEKRSFQEVLQEKEQRKCLRIIKLQEVTSMTSLCRTVIYERIKKGEFPPPISLGSRASGWIQSEIEAWIQKQINERDKATA